MHVADHPSQDSDEPDAIGRTRPAGAAGALAMTKVPGERSRTAPFEADLQDEWAATAGAVVTVANGEVVRVRFPGWRNRGAGPDFRDAVIEARGTTVRGDVEVHRDARDWVRHGHDADPRYANVVLHVVGDDADGVPGPARRASASSIGAASSGHPAEPFGCRRGSPPDAEVVRASLVAAGMARFRVAASRLGARLGGDRRAATLVADARAGAEAMEQAIFEEVAGALGYAGNEGAMRRCAAAVTLAAIRAMPASDGPADAGRLGDPGPDAAVARLLAAAGLDGRPGGVDSRAGRGDGGPPIRWMLAGVRPGNHPRRRLAELVAIARAWPEGGMVAAVQAVLRETVASPRRAGPRLRALVAAQVRPVGAPSGASPVVRTSSSRASDIAVNVLLPLARAAAARSGDALGVRRAEAAYAAHPPLAGNAVITRVAARLGWAPREIARTAAAQQGLIAIWDGPCRPLRCASCPMGNAAEDDGPAP